MNINFEFDFDELAFRKAMEEAASDAVHEAARDIQRIFDRFHGTHAGQPVEEVLAVLRSAARASDWEFDESDLRGYAHAISEGTRVTVHRGPNQVLGH